MIICRRNPNHSSDHLLHLGPKRLVHKEQKMKTVVVTCQGSTPNRDLRTACGLLCIHGSPHNPLQTAHSSTRKQHHQQKCCCQGNNQQIRTSIGHVLYQGQATQVSTGRLRETYPHFSHNPVANSRPYMRSFTRKQLDQ